MNRMSSGPVKPIVLPDQAVMRKKWTAVLPAGLLSTGITLLFYTSMTAFILFLILTCIHFTIYPIFSFSESDDGIIHLPTASDQQASFTGVIAQPDISANLMAIPNCGYTIGFDTFLSGEFVSTETPRVLLYRSRVPVAMSSADREETILDRFPNTNLLVYLDPVKNDMIVAVATSDGVAARKTLRKIPAIENIPIRKVFRTTIVFTESFVEVYLNGQLAQSMPMTEPPLPQDATFDFYTTPALVGSNGKLANLQFWPRPLRARDVRANGEPIATETLFTAPKKT